MKILPLDFPCPVRLALVCSMVFLPSVVLAETNSGDANDNGVIAEMNGRVVTKYQFRFLVAPKLRVIEKQFPDKGEEYAEFVAKAKKGVLKELLDRQDMIVHFDHLNIEISIEKVEEEIQREIRDTYQGDSNLLQEALKASRMTMEGYRSLLRERLLESEIKKRIIEKNFKSLGPFRPLKGEGLPPTDTPPSKLDDKTS